MISDETLLALIRDDRAASPFTGEGHRKVWGITPSFAFVAEPQTNGVAERFNRTLKEQAIYGQIFRTVDDVREAVKTFVELYNNEWRVEKNGFRSPDEIRQAA